MGDCRNARVRLRRRLETKYIINRVSVKAKTITVKNELGKEMDETKIIPRIMVTIDLNHKKDDFIVEEHYKLKNECKNFVVKVDYFKNSCSDYKIAFLADNIDIGLERVKKYAFSEIVNNVIPELEKIYEEVKIS